MTKEKKNAKAEAKPTDAKPTAEKTKNAEAKAKPTKAKAKSTEKALIIEDDFDASIIFTRALEANGYTTEQIYDGEKARARLANGEIPDIVLLDMHLPNVQGKDLLKEIRADERFAQSRIIVVTADSGMADMVREQSDLVLLKPTTYTQVRDFTARLLRRMG